MKCRFEIVGLSGIDGIPNPLKVNGKQKYRRLLIKKVKEEDIKEPNDVALLMEYNKKFLIIGNANAITNKDIFPHIANGEVFIRTKDCVINFTMHFKTPDGEKTASALWYTNLDSRHLCKGLNLTKEYSPEEYPKYGNYDAIDVGCVKNIPVNYDGVMGVPISVLLYDLEKYEIVGCPDANVLPDGWRGMTKEFVDLYYAQGNTGQYQEGKRLAYYVTKDGMAKIPYKRILIRRK